MSNKLRQDILKEIKFLLKERETGSVYDHSTELSTLLKQAEDAKKRNGSVSQDFIKKIEQKALEIYEICRYPKPAKVNAGMCNTSIDIAGFWEDQIQSLVNFVTDDPYHTSARKAEEYIQYIKNQINRPAGQTTQPESPPSVGPKTPTDSSSGELTGTSFKCKDETLIVKFQKYLKNNGAKICADGKFGPKTFAAARTRVNFNMFADFNVFRNQAQRNQLCNTIASDSRYSKFNGAPEVCRRSSPSPKSQTQPPTQPQGQQDVLRTLAASDTGWQQKVNQDQTNKFVSAYNQNQAFRNAVDIAASQGILNTDWIYNNYKNYIREPLEELYNFYDKQKVDGANLLYEKLIKLYVGKEK